jgi:hypothetical protein
MTTDNNFYEEYKNDKRILTRRGIYSSSKAMEQLYQALKTAKNDY